MGAYTKTDKAVTEIVIHVERHPEASIKRAKIDEHTGILFILIEPGKAFPGGTCDHPMYSFSTSSKFRILLGDRHVGDTCRESYNDNRGHKE